MSRLINNIVAGTVAAMALLPACETAAQTSTEPGKAVPQIRRGIKTPAQLKGDIKKRHPLLSKAMRIDPSSLVFKEEGAGPVALQTGTPGARRVLTLADGRELWGCVVYENGQTKNNPHYGLYSIKTSPLTVNQKWTLPWDASINYEYPNAGSRFDDGKFGFFYADTEYASIGYVFTKYLEYDYTTGENTLESMSVSNALYAMETAQDEATGDVYGVFYNADFSGLEFGKIDFSQLHNTALDEEQRITRSTIGTTSHMYLALGISSDKTLYGVANDGNLYRINSATGSETLVGATGVPNVVNSAGSFFVQSGEIDQTTDTFYWVCTDLNAHSALYTVDLATGKAAKVGDMPNNESVTALSLPPAEATASAPLGVTSLTAQFAAGSNMGSISFTMPAATSDGTPLAGQLPYTIYANGIEVKSGTAAAGTSVSETVTAPDGMVTFTVRAFNGSTPGKKTVVRTFVGTDQPKNVTNVNLSIDEATAQATVTWDAVTEGVNGGYIGDITYNVVRYPDGKTVATGLAGTSYTETLDRQYLTIYSYGVTAVGSNGNTTDETKTGNVKFGDAMKLPFSETFDNVQEFELFTVIDANSDRYTWEYDAYNKRVNSGYGNAQNTADDWLVTPALHMKKDMVYRVRFFASSGFESFPEKMEVKYGNGNAVADMTETLMPAQVLPYQDARQERHMFEYLLKSDRDQTVYIGFHAVSDKDMYRIFFDDLSIDAGSSVNVPAGVENVKITPDATSALRATVEFDAPALNLNGKALDDDGMTVTVSRDGAVVETVHARAGAHCTVHDDNVDTKGMHTYTFGIANSYGAGTKVSASAYVGEDTPQAPANRKLSDKLTAVGITWDKVAATGKNGGVVLPEKVKYNIYTISHDDYGQVVPSLFATTGDTHYDIPSANDEGDMRIVQYALSASNGEGESDIMYTSSMLAGKPYQLPVVESFKGGALEGYWWMSRRGTSPLNMSTAYTYDNDGGAAMFTGYMAGDSVYLNSAKIDLSGAAKPALLFYHSGTPGSKMRIVPIVATPDGKETSLKTIDYSTMTGESRWTSEHISLDGYRNSRYIIVKLLLVAGEEDKTVYLDNINIREFLAHDLQADIKAPEKLVKGKANKVDVVVTNEGEQQATGYTVSLALGGKTLGSVSETGVLESFAAKTYTFDVPVSVNEQAGMLSLTADVDYAADEKTANNHAEANVETAASELTPTSGVAAAQSGSDVTVTWNKVDFDKQTVTETFDDVNPWITDNINGWTTYDADGGMTGELIEGVGYPHQNDAFAYIVFNPEQFYTGLSEAPSFAPHSGSQYLAAIYSGKEGVGGQIEIIDADNWLISPRLSGDGQTISFYVSNVATDSKNYTEKYEVYTSDDDNDIANFVKLGGTRATIGTDWDEVSVDVPAGTKYMAIRHVTNSSNAFVFKVDDITYTLEGDAPIAYNIYRDGVKVGTVEAGGDASFTDAGAPAGSHTYSVTVVYAGGESAPAYAGVDTGIEGIAADAAGSFGIYTVDGKAVGTGIKSAKALKGGVYIVNKRKVAVK